MKKRIKIKVPPNIDLEKFIDELMGAVYAQYANYTIRGNEVLLTIVGDPASITRTEYSLRRVTARFQVISRSRMPRMSRIPKSMTASVLGKPVPTDLLTSALEVEGIGYEDEGDELVVEASIDELTHMASELFNLYQASRELFSGAARKVAALVAYSTGMGLDEVYSKAIERGVMVKGEDGRARLRLHRERAFSLLLGDVFE